LSIQATRIEHFAQRSAVRGAAKFDCAVKSSGWVLVTLRGRSMSPTALEIAENCRSFFAATHARPHG